MKYFIISALLLWTVFNESRLLSETAITCNGTICAEGQACGISGSCAKTCYSHADCNNPNLACDIRTTPNTCTGNGCSLDSQCVGPSLCDSVQRFCTIVPGACTSNVHCASNEVCDMDSGRCLLTCTSSSDCGAGQICGNLRGCVNQTTHCWTDAECNQDQVCNTVRQQCIPAPTKCAFMYNCDVQHGQICHYFEGRCRRPCQSHSDCYYPNTYCGYPFLPNRCIPRPCTEDHHCDGDSKCIGSFCSKQYIPCPHDPTQLCHPGSLPN